MTDAGWIGLASAVMTLSTFAYAVFSKTSETRTTSLEKRLVEIEQRMAIVTKENAECQQDRARYITENLVLMRRINTLMDEAEQR